MTFSLGEATKLVLAEMAKLSPKELRADLDRHSVGSFATAVRETREFPDFNGRAKCKHGSTS